MARKRATTENLLAVLTLYEVGSYGAAANILGRDADTVRYHLNATREVYATTCWSTTKASGGPPPRACESWRSPARHAP